MDEQRGVITNCTQVQQHKVDQQPHRVPTDPIETLQVITNHKQVQQHKVDQQRGLGGSAPVPGAPPFLPKQPGTLPVTSGVQPQVSPSLAQVGIMEEQQRQQSLLQLRAQQQQPQPPPAPSAAPALGPPNPPKLGGGLCCAPKTPGPTPNCGASCSASSRPKGGSRPRRSPCTTCSPPRGPPRRSPCCPLPTRPWGRGGGQLPLLHPPPGQPWPGQLGGPRAPIPGQMLLPPGPRGPVPPGGLQPVQTPSVMEEDILMDLI
ncbi:mediator of RNA polymerase II transcription subunit 25-like [Aphelocoma coerulescens]|uniref:mediator of RNA polymerase II transcription subunit 25-like n=1 Tax=Aphelocoma coerulescens TaxID=39617 RepID=UPI0036051A12